MRFFETFRYFSNLSYFKYFTNSMKYFMEKMKYHGQDEYFMEKMKFRTKVYDPQ